MRILLIFPLLYALVSAASFEPVQVMCEINGQLVPAMIDTGAEITVMSASCAKRCRIHNLIDTQHSGKAIGVGFSEIIGGIEGLGMRIGPLNFQNKVSILRHSRCDFLIGLDILERFKCEISLKDKLLKFNVRGDEVRIPLTSASSRSANNNHEYPNPPTTASTTKSNERAPYSWIAQRENVLSEDKQAYEKAKNTMRKIKFGNVITSEEEEEVYQRNNKPIEPPLDYDEEDDLFIFDEKNISLEGV